MKKMTIIFVLLLLTSCSNDDEDNKVTKETDVLLATDIQLATGINIRNSEFSEVTQLGNPNVFINSKFIAFPNPPAGVLSLSSSENISSVWVIKVNAVKIYQQTDFSSILNSDLYDESEIKLDPVIESVDLNSNNVTLNLENLKTGYYRVFVKINGSLYWDNIYIPENNVGIDELINFWN